MVSMEMHWLQNYAFIEIFLDNGGIHCICFTTCQRKSVVHSSSDMLETYLESLQIANVC